ncbi:ROK family protein [Pedobacter punctiformis]|uniref:ROK family protein n=1 Tax=Pedobacter punctiformis TaxID=3004097 RepID=A0ABT4LC11_9SPHI|nr:ROK family protein [Pedobacter sp. HCMS5-2]MCZ4245454.1 ROK family protein [Pedobacter sp. HCMS5-2]
MMTNKHVLGVDIGGSHITAAVLNMEDRSLLGNSYTRTWIDSHGKPEQIIQSWTNTINLACQKTGLKVEKFGIAMPGPFDYDQGISYIAGNDKYEAFYGLNVKNMLAGALNILPDDILMKNDASCFLAGEVFAGAAKGYENVIGITLGTGLGSAVLKNKEAKDANLWCSPFLDGIAEDYLSTRWFLKRYYEISGLNILNVKVMTGLYNYSPTVREIFMEFANNLAAFLKVFQQEVKADAIVIGGNIANASENFLPWVIKQLKTFNIEIPVLISTLNEHAAIAGAASCWENKPTAGRSVNI